MEKRDSSTQNKRAAVHRLLDEKASLFRRQGFVTETWRMHKGRRMGPYYRLFYYEDGRKRSVYLGTDETLALEVRQALQELQAPRKEKRQLQNVRKQIRRELARHRAEWNRELLREGLYLKGSEVRGWRHRR